MRYLFLCFLLLSVHVSLGVVNVTSIFAVYAQPDTEWFDIIGQQQLETEEYVQSEVTSSSANFGFGDFIKALWYFAKAVGRSIWAPTLLSDLGLIAPFNYFIGIPWMFMYLLAIIQIIRGFGFGGAK